MEGTISEQADPRVRREDDARGVWRWQNEESSPILVRSRIDHAVEQRATIGAAFEASIVTMTGSVFRSLYCARMRSSAGRLIIWKPTPARSRCRDESPNARAAPARGGTATAIVGGGSDHRSRVCR